MKIIYFFPLTLLLLGGCSLTTKQETEPTINDFIVPVDHEYSEVGDYMITWDKMFDLDLDVYYVYFYSSGCSHCSEIKNFMIEKALEEKNIYFSKSSAKDILRKDTQSSIGAGFAGDISILGYPSLIKIEDGICTKNVAGKPAILSMLS